MLTLFSKWLKLSLFLPILALAWMYFSTPVDARIAIAPGDTSVLHQSVNVLEQEAGLLETQHNELLSQIDAELNQLFIDLSQTRDPAEIDQINQDIQRAQANKDLVTKELNQLLPIFPAFGGMRNSIDQMGIECIGGDVQTPATQLTQELGGFGANILDLQLPIQILIDEINLFVDICGQIQPSPTPTPTPTPNPTPTPTPDPTDQLLNRCNIAKAQADQTLEEGETFFGGSTSGPCPPELVAKLLQQKAELEGLKAEVKAQQKVVNSELRQANKDINKLTREINKKRAKINAWELKIQENKGKIDNLQKEIDDLDEEIKEDTDRLRDLETIFTSSPNIESSTAEDPLDGIESGAAITFDGGKTWIVAIGEAGVDEMTEIIKNNRSIVKEMNGIKKDLKKAEKQKEKKQNQQEKLKDKNDELDKKIKDCEDELLILEAQLNSKIQERDALQTDANDLKTQATELNNKIKAFNKMAKDCGIRAKELVIEKKKQIDRLPPSVKQEVEDELEETLTEEEKDAVERPGKHTSAAAGAGQTLESAAEKMDAALGAHAACTPGEKRQIEKSREEIESRFIRGVEEVKVTDFGGIRGVSSETLKGDVNTALVVLAETLEIGNDIAGDLAEGTPFEAATAYLDFVTEATGEIAEVLQEWAEEGEFLGLPEWIDVEMGRFWHRHLYKEKVKTDIYVCIDNIITFSHTQTTKEEQLGRCVYFDPIEERVSISLETINFTGDCTASKCNDAFPPAMEYAMETALRTNNIDLIGKCE